MRISSAIRTALIALVAFVGSSAASYADSGFVTLTIYKAGWIIGGSGGSGTLDFHGRSYPLSTGGLDFGLVFGGSKTVVQGTVSNIWWPTDIAGVYGAAGGWVVLLNCAAAVRLEKPKRRRAGTARMAARFPGECGSERTRHYAKLNAQRHASKMNGLAGRSSRELERG